MNAIVRFKALAAAMAAITAMALVLAGCGDKGTGPGGGGSGGDIVLPNNYAWIIQGADGVSYSSGYAFRLDGAFLAVTADMNGDWKASKAGTWSTEGNKLSMTYTGVTTPQEHTYSVSGNTLILTQNRVSVNYKKTEIGIETNPYSIVLEDGYAWLTRYGSPQQGYIFKQNGQIMWGAKNGTWDEEVFGRWSTNGNYLTITYPDGEKLVTIYTISGNEPDIYLSFGGSSFYKTSLTTFYSLTTSVNPSNGGSVSRVPPMTHFAEGATVTVRAVPKSGYEFTGWTGAATSADTAVTLTMNGDKTLTANFRQIDTPPPTSRQFVVAFNTDGGTPAAIASVTVDSGAAIGAAKLPPDPAKTGYTFAGWFSGNTQYTAATVINGDVTLTAKWTDVPVEPPEGRQFIVAFNTDGGTPAAIASVTVDSGTAIGASLPTAPTKTNYTFAG